MTPRLDPADLLCDYISIDSSHPDAETHKTAEFLKNILRARGVDTAIFSGKPYKNNLIAKLPGQSESPIVLLHHMDVVSGDPEQFTPETKNGCVWGRGAIDDKGLGIIHLLAFLRLLRDVKLGRKLSRPVWLLAVADEEVGGEFGGKYVARMLFGDSESFDTPPVVFDEGGYWILDMFKRPVANIAIVEKRRALIRLTFEGIETHGSIPPRNRDESAVLKMIDALNALESIKRPMILNAATEEVAKTVRHLQMGGLPVPLRLVSRLASWQSDKFYALTHDTVGVTTMKTSTKDANVVSGGIEVMIDVRILPSTNWEEMLSGVKSVLDRTGLRPGRDYHLEVVEEPDDSAVSNPNHRAVSAIHQVVGKYDPESEVTISQLPGISDSRFFRLKGCECYGFVPVKITEDQLGNIHGSRERIPIEGLKKGIDIMYNVVSRLI